MIRRFLANRLIDRSNGEIVWKYNVVVRKANLKPSWAVTFRSLEFNSMVMDLTLETGASECQVSRDWVSECLSDQVLQQKSKCLANLSILDRFAFFKNKIRSQSENEYLPQELKRTLIRFLTLQVETKQRRKWRQSQVLRIVGKATRCDQLVTRRVRFRHLKSNVIFWNTFR